MKPAPDIDDPSVSGGNGIYIHVPFCLKRCRYCDFFSTVRLDLVDPFIEACKAEAGMVLEPSCEVDSIYFGGGTPSLISPRRVGELLDTVSGLIDLAGDCEITIEANPGTVDEAKLREYRLAGVNRINLGVQSFDDGILDFLGRIHSGRQARRAIESARRAGFDNLGLDLIYGLAGQTAALWEQDLLQAVAAVPEHISCYMLTVEGETEFSALERRGKAVRLDDRKVAELFVFTVSFLEDRGWMHYEVSNFARQVDNTSSSFVSRHNSKYWSYQPYLGLGPSAHSFDGEKQRSWNCSSLDKYLEATGRGCLPRSGREVLTAQQQLLERIYLGLRTAAGLDLEVLEKDFATLYPAVGRGLEVIVREGWGELERGRLRLNLDGLLRLDGICRLLAGNIG